MNCRDYQNQISLLLYEELLETEKPGLTEHLRQCESCRLVMEDEKGLHHFLSADVAAWELPSDLLVESRRSLANELDQIENKRAWWHLPTFSVVFTPMRLLESAALVAMGLALGVYFSNQQVDQQPYAAAMVPETVSSPIPPNASVSNLRIVSSNPTTGEVEVAGEVVQSLRFQGKMMDATVRELLFVALRDESNPGSRLRAVEVLAREANNQAVKEALIQALTGDGNPGVRLRALQGLKEFAAEEDVREALMHTLANDTEAGIRVEAIDALTRYSEDTALAKTLEEATREEDNSYVRMRVLQFVGNSK